MKKEEQVQPKPEVETPEVKKSTITPEEQSHPSESQSKSLVYDRDFLLQFQPLHKDRPDNLPPMDELIIVEEKGDRDRMKSSTGSQTRIYKDTSRERLGRSGNAPPGFGLRSSKGGPMSPAARSRTGKKVKSPTSSDQPGLEATPGRWEPMRWKRDIPEEEAILRKVKGYSNLMLLILNYGLEFLTNLLRTNSILLVLKL